MTPNLNARGLNVSVFASQFENIFKQEKRMQELGITFEVQVQEHQHIPKIPASLVSEDNSEGEIVGRSVVLSSALDQLDFLDERGLAMMACHEVGHILGGAPYVKNASLEFINPLFGLSNQQKSQLSSVEGQADYFATNDCFRLWHDSLGASIQEDFTSLSETSPALTLCSQSAEQPLCLNKMAAIEQFIEMVQYLLVLEEELSFEDSQVSLFTKSEEVASFTNKSPQYYPEFACRVETLVAGALNQQRPQCWYVH